MMQEKALTIEVLPDTEGGGFTASVPNIPAYGDGKTEEQIADLKLALRGSVQTFGLEEARA